MSLTPEQQRQICELAKYGCDREVAASIVRCSWTDLQQELANHPSFAKELSRSEAAAELVHVRNVQEASRDVKNWRTSVWWLERRAPNRYGRRDARSIRPEQLEEFINDLSRRMSELVTDEEVRAELIECARASMDKLQPMPEEEDYDEL